MKLATLFAALALAAIAAPASAADAYRAPRNAFGAPDLQGVWSSDSMTHLQRPKDFKQLAPSPYEAAAYETSRHERYDKAVAPTARDAPAPEPGEVTDESAQWSTRPTRLMRLSGEIRTSWIVEPQDGKLPFTEASRAASDQALKNEEVYDDPESRSFDERCLLGGGGGVAAPIVNSQLIQVVQTRDRLVIFGEQNHEARIIRIGDAHLPAAVAPWMGDSIGRWEGETLVVETTGLSPSDRWRWSGGVWIPISAGAKITERFTRTRRGELVYSFTVDDPANYTRSWRAEVVYGVSAQPMFEYACHEGNYALMNILRGARVQDAAKAAKAPTAARP